MTAQDERGQAATPYRVLARKYRPTNFAELIGQKAMVRTLSNAIASDRLAHAFILTGVRGVGKTTTARIIARTLNCVGPDGTGGPTAEPCGQCEHCRAIAEDRHVDVIEMDAASRTGVDDIRELIEGVRYKPATARYKVYIIDEVHMLSKNAFNALLKTLEEPPEHVTFIFATTEIRRVPVTVLSRCQRFDLRRVEAETLIAHLAMIADKEEVRIDKGALALITRAADGSVRDGLSLLDQAIAHAGSGIDGETIIAERVRDMLGLADRILLFDLFEKLTAGEIADSLDLFDDMYRSGADPAAVLQDLLELTHWLTRLKVVSTAGDSPTVPEAERVRGGELAEKLSMGSLARAWQMLLKGLTEVQTAPAPLLAAEMLLVRLAYAAELPTPAELAQVLDMRDGGSAVTTGPTAASATAQSSMDLPTDGNAGGRSTTSSAQGGAATAIAAQPEMTLAAPDLTAPEPVETPNGNHAPMPQSFEAVVALCEQRREPVLHAHLMRDLHLVAFEPGRIEFNPTAQAPDNLANRLGELLSRWTGARWMVTVSSEPGAPTLAEQEAAAETQLRRDAATHPLVQAALETFPGATIEAVRPIGGQPDDVADQPGDIPGDEEETS
jgi:DNA polymerase-3 subunit gamma/tau